MYNLIIVGGGASGLMAGIVAGRRGKKVLILEKLSSVGKKILATGNGRCNLTNRDLNFSHFHSENRDFFKYALESFNYQKTISFFKNIGVEIREEKGGKIFPLSLQSSTIKELLEYELKELNIEIRYNSNIHKIRKERGYFIIELKNSTPLKSKKLLISTGGIGARHLGSCGDGYRFAKFFNHNITPIFPSLVQLKSNENYLKRVNGVKIEASISLFINNKLEKSLIGDLLFRDYGVSGSGILDISRLASKALLEKKRVHLSINLLPQFSREELNSLLIKRFELKPKKTISISLIGIINKKLIPPLLERATISDKNVANLSKRERNRIIYQLQNWQIPITATKEFKYAEVSAGGVDSREINPKTMESKIIKNLYFAGEVIDVDGDCGGYNLQWAWSSGHIVGSSI